MLTEFIYRNADYIVVGAIFLLFYVVGVYLKTYITKKVNEPKLGTAKGCEDCIAMAKIPVIENNQIVLRRDELPKLSNQIARLQEAVDTLEASVSKLFNLIEQSWLAQINRLESAFIKDRGKHKNEKLSKSKSARASRKN